MPARVVGHDHDLEPVGVVELRLFGPGGGAFDRGEDQAGGPFGGPIGLAVSFRCRVFHGGRVVRRVSRGEWGHGAIESKAWRIGRMMDRDDRDERF